MIVIIRFVQAIQMEIQVNWLKTNSLQTHITIYDEKKKDE